MSVGVENEGCIMITSSFTEMYNKWLHELTNIETNLVCKAKEIQQLQNSLNNEAENLTHVQDTLTSTQIEQNYIEDLLKTFIIEQEELEREISKLEEINYDDVEINNEEYEEYPAILESVEKELESLKEPIHNIVNQLNNKINKIDKTESPLSIYCTILDRYDDALQTLKKNTDEVEEKLNKLCKIQSDLSEIHAEQYIPSTLSHYLFDKLQ